MQAEAQAQNVQCPMSCQPPAVANVAVVLKVLGTSPVLRHEVSEVPADLDALDDLVLSTFHQVLAGRPHRLYVDGRRAAEADLVGARLGQKLVVHVQRLADCEAPDMELAASGSESFDLNGFGTPAPSIACAPQGPGEDETRELGAADKKWQPQRGALTDAFVAWAGQVEHQLRQKQRNFLMEHLHTSVPKGMWKPFSLASRRAAPSLSSPYKRPKPTGADPKAAEPPLPSPKTSAKKADVGFPASQDEAARGGA